MRGGFVDAQILKAGQSIGNAFQDWSGIAWSGDF